MEIEVFNLAFYLMSKYVCLSNMPSFNVGGLNGTTKIGQHSAVQMVAVAQKEWILGWKRHLDMKKVLIFQTESL